VHQHHSMAQGQSLADLIVHAAKEAKTASVSPSRSTASV
jgi:hypothetical protein